MNFFDMLFSALFNVLSLYVNVRVIKLFLPSRMTGKKNMIFVYACIWAVNWAVYYFINIYNLTTLSLFIGLLAASCIMFEGSIWSRLAAVTVSLASGSIFENIVWEIGQRGILPIDSDIAGGLCAVLSEFICILLIEKFLHLDRYIKLPRGGYTNILLLSVGSVILSEIMLQPENSDDMIMLGLSLICLINVSTYYIYEKISESYRRELEKSVMEQQMEMYGKQIDIIKRSQEEMRSVRHDMKNHISLIGIYLRGHEYEKACEYAEKLGKQIETPKEYINTGNFGIDSILNYKLGCIDEDMGCELRISVNIPEQLSISDLDLNILLGNLLDNSLEAIERAEDKCLSINLAYMKGTLFINISNTFSDMPHIENGKYMSSKTADGDHGIGLGNVERIVKKYKGSMKIDLEGSMFEVKIIIYV